MRIQIKYGDFKQLRKFKKREKERVRLAGDKNRIRHTTHTDIHTYTQRTHTPSYHDPSSAKLLATFPSSG